MPKFPRWSNRALAVKEPAVIVSNTKSPFTASSAVVRLRTSGDNYINTGQNLGIGTTSPSYKVHIVDNSNATTGLKIDNTNTGTSARNGVFLLNNSGSQAAMVLPSTNYTGVSGWANRLVFSTDSNISGGILMRPANGGFKVSASGLNNNDLVVTSAGR